MNHLTQLRQREQAAPELPQLLDQFGRVHRSMRISVTDACNIRCQYCMPDEGVAFLKSQRLLSFEAIERLVAVTVGLGVEHYRITGGEPLLRPNLHQLVARLSCLAGVNDLALTTNGMLLAQCLPDLLAAGLQRVNISLDTLSESVFQRLTRRQGLARVLEGIEAAVAAPNLQVKLNALVLRDVNLDDVMELIEFAVARGIPLRFIEFMPLDGDRSWSHARVVRGDELRAMVAQRFGPLQPLPADDPSQPAAEYALSCGGRLGFIDSVSMPFCRNCDRLRLTADGKIRNCLFGQEEWEVRSLLDSQADARQLTDVLRRAVWAKHAAHGIAEPGFRPPDRAMYQIGG